jgi:AICAR transformylase/IMP cyclohydrolase PurH
LPIDGKPAALLSVYERRGVVELARALAAAGLTIYATGGTRTHLVEHGIEALDVGDLTGFPSLFDGRVKTLHPRVFGGILADRSNAGHLAEAEKHGVPAISTVVVNLYPFEKTVAKPGASLQEAVEQIDIGGVSLIRAAAKNFEHVTVLVDPEQYGELIEALPAGVDRAARRRFATRAFERTAEYDAAIARYLEAGLIANELPGSLALTVPLAQPLRYGENPQSRAAFYLGHGHALPEQLWGKELSYNNLLDLDATLRLLVRAPIGAGGGGAHGTQRAAIVKHTVPCGVAERDPIRSRPTAGSSPSTGRSTWRARGRWVISSSRSSQRPRSSPTPWRTCSARRTCESSATTGASRSRSPTSCGSAAPWAGSSPRTTIRRPSPRSGRSSRNGRRARANGAISSSPGTSCAT